MWYQCTEACIPTKTTIVILNKKAVKKAYAFLTASPA